MFPVTRLRAGEVYLNSDLVELVEATPDTTILMFDGKRFVVEESVEEVVARIARWKGRVFAEAGRARTDSEDRADRAEGRAR